MLLNIISLVLVLLIAYMWMTRGFFSALIHFICTIIAGAIAFAFWESIAYALLDGTEAAGIVEGSAWAIALAVPFAVSLAVLRFAADRVLRSNVIVNDKVNYAGGGLLGLASGVIAVGIFAISATYLRVDFLGCKSYEYSSSGNIVRKGGMWVPFDQVTAKLYAGLSERALRSDEPLARWHPAIHEMGNGMRTSAFEDNGRNAFRPSDFDVRGRFVLGGKGHPFADLLKDNWNSNLQNVVDPAGQAYPPDTHIEGFVVVFQAGSREKDGRTAIGAAQIMLVSENADEERDVSFPIAVTSQADPATPGAARFRFDAAGTFIASVGSASEATMAFEFPCREGYQPVALYVKGVRFDVANSTLSSKPTATFATYAERDGGLSSMGVGNPAALPSASEDPNATAVVQTQSRPGVVATIPGVSITNAIPIYTLQEGQHGNVDIQKTGREWFVVSGTLEAAKADAEKWGNVTERSLRIGQFIAVNDRVMVQVEVSKGTRTSLLGRSFDAAEALLPPVLVDTQGEMYQPVGYIYVDESSYKMVFDPGKPIRAMTEMPTLSSSRPAQRLILIFQVSLGRQIKSFNKGQKEITKFEPPINCDQQQKNG